MDPESERAEQRAWAGEVVEVIGRLPERQATALRFAYFHGMSSTEVAHRMDMSVLETTRTLAGGLLRLGRLLQA